MTDKEPRWHMSCHEAGHAVIAYKLSLLDRAADTEVSISITAQVQGHLQRMRSFR
jgi:hypothetical protein